MLGEAVFVDTTGDRIPRELFSLCKDPAKIREYAWGAATLAHLYRRLGMASRAEMRGLSGCLTLLQVWIFEYFPMFRPGIPTTTSYRWGLGVMSQRYVLEQDHFLAHTMIYWSNVGTSTVLLLRV